MIFETAILAFILACEPRKCSTVEGNHVVFFDSNTRTIHVEPPTQPEISINEGFAEGLEAALAKDLASVREVRCVLTEQADGNLLVWIAIDDPGSFEIRSRIYEKELGLMDGFPEVNFDFNLILSMGRSPRELATGAQVVYSRA